MAFNSSIDLLKNYEFIKVGTKLKDTFSSAQEMLIGGYLMYEFVERLFDNEIPKQETAFIEFSAHLPDSRRDEFRKAWQDYKCKDKEAFIDEYAIDDTVPERDQDNIENRNRILKRIDDILHFADPIK